MKKISKSMAKKIALMVMLSSAVGMHSVWADDGYGNYDSTTKTITITGAQGNNEYSQTNYVGVNAATLARRLNSNVTLIKTKSGGVDSTVYGIKTDNGDVAADSIPGGIDVKSTGGEAYAICLEGTCTNTISGLGGIVAEAGGTAKAVGIDVKNTGSNTFSVGFSTSGDSISVFSETGENYGIRFNSGSTGISEVKNVKTITAGICPTDSNYVSSSDAYGIKAIAGTNTVTFTGAGSSITAKSSGGFVNGIMLIGSGTNTISDLGSITAEASSSKGAYGIYAFGGTNEVTFKGDGGQAITAKSSGNAYSIYAAEQGATTVTFESSILSGKVGQDGSATLTLNFDNGGVWTPRTGDVTGTVTVKVNNGGSIRVIETAGTYEPSGEGYKTLDLSGGTVNVTVNAGGTMDLRSRNDKGEVILNENGNYKTINFGSGSFTAATGSVLSFDAFARGNGLTTDQIKTTGTVSGTIALGSVNVKYDEATSAWETAKKANIFVNGASQAQTGIAITGQTQTLTSNNYLYTFTGGANGNVSVTSVYANYTLPQIIQGFDDVAKGINAYSLNGNQVLTADLGILDNSSRTSGLTIYGNNKTISKGTATNGTVTLAQTTDILTLQGVTVSGFTKFADNAGTLNLSGVTFTGTTGADVITGTGKTVISGVVTADKNIAQQVELQSGANLTATGISVNGTGKVKGIYVNMANASDIASASVGTITAKSSGDDAYGIFLEGIGTNTISGLGSITAETAGSVKSAYGIYSKNTNTDTTSVQLSIKSRHKNVFQNPISVLY